MHMPRPQREVDASRRVRRRLEYLQDSFILFRIIEASVLAASFENSVLNSSIIVYLKLSSFQNLSIYIDSIFGIFVRDLMTRFW